MDARPAFSSLRYHIRVVQLLSSQTHGLIADQPILTISTNMRRCTVIGMTMLQLGAIDNKRLAWILLDYERLSFLYANLASGLVAVCLD
jgi:hypothetical protein